MAVTIAANQNHLIQYANLLCDYSFERHLNRNEHKHNALFRRQSHTNSYAPFQRNSICTETELCTLWDIELSKRKYQLEHLAHKPHHTFYMWLLRLSRIFFLQFLSQFNHICCEYDKHNQISMQKNCFITLIRSFVMILSTFKFKFVVLFVVICSCRFLRRLSFNYNCECIAIPSIVDRCTNLLNFPIVLVLCTLIIQSTLSI